MSAFSRPQAIVDAFVEALNAKDADAVGAVFTEEAEFVNIMGVRMHRREGIVAGHRWAFAGPLLGTRVGVDQVDELPVTDDVIVLHARCLRERGPDAGARSLPDGASMLTFVTRRGPQGWQAVAATNVAESAPPGPA
jgi:uncharacterized protein (TIGR02246 family)